MHTWPQGGTTSLLKVPENWSMWLWLVISVSTSGQHQANLTFTQHHRFESQSICPFPPTTNAFLYSLVSYIHLKNNIFSLLFSWSWQFILKLTTLPIQYLVYMCVGVLWYSQMYKCDFYTSSVVIRKAHIGYARPTLSGLFFVFACTVLISECAPGHSSMFYLNLWLENVHIGL